MVAGVNTYCCFRPSTQSACFARVTSVRMSRRLTMACSKPASSVFSREGSTASPMTSIRPMFSFFDMVQLRVGMEHAQGKFLRGDVVAQDQIQLQKLPPFAGNGVMALWGSPSVSAKRKAFSSV